MKQKHWMITNHFADGMYLHVNGGWTSDKVAAARFSTSEKDALDPELSHIAGGKWVFDHASLEDLTFSLDIARDQIDTVAKAMAMLGMSGGAKKLMDASRRLIAVQRLVGEME